MVRKKIDNRIRKLIEHGVATSHRSLFVIVGDKGRDQIVILHHMLSKAVIKARPDVLWCYKKELGFASNKKKRMRQLQKKIKSGNVDVNEDDPFELFIASTNIRYCYYTETHKILGNTYGMCVLQDFEALTPNLLARTIETVEGGGIIVMLLRSVTSLKQLYTLCMDVHGRFRTEAHQDVVGRFNERFILSLGSCENCVVTDDSLNVLPISSHAKAIQSYVAPTSELAAEEVELRGLKESLREVQPLGVLVNLCKTYDQAKALLKFIDAISEKRINATVSLTAARGRGKSAALGLSIAAAVAFRYSNIYVTSPNPENLKTLFHFVLKGFEALEYQEHMDYEVIQSSNPDFNKAITRINFFRDHRQVIQYIQPTESLTLGQAELLVIDEAAAIPLTFVKALFGPYLIFLSSTLNGYEGTGRSLSLKLLQQLRDHKCSDAAELGKHSVKDKVLGRTLAEVTLDESIRYRPGDAVENWLTNLLCLDATLTPPMTSGCPPPESCELYYVNRDTLFCYHKASEAFLQKLMSLYVASHYKNSPNDLQMLSDAPAHHIFALLGPTSDFQKALPDVLALIQVCLEGEISKGSIAAGLSRGHRASGDLIPWTVAQQFHDQDFPLLSGARIIRIAVHPDYHKMGYGSRALKLLEDYYNEKFIDISENLEKAEPIGAIDEPVDLLTENIAPRLNLPPLLLKLKERPPERLHYLGVSYGVTSPLLKFWKRAGFVPIYMRQTPSELTGEHSCIMLKVLSNPTARSVDTTWVQEYWADFRRRFIALLSYEFKSFATSLAVSILSNNTIGGGTEVSEMTTSELMTHLITYDIKRLELYTKNMADYHLIMDLVPTFARLFFLGKMNSVHISAVQSALLLGMGLQHKKVDELSKEFDIPGTQILGLFNRIAKKTLDFINRLLETSMANSSAQLVANGTALMKPLAESLSEEFRVADIEQRKLQREELGLLKQANLAQYAIKGDAGSWSTVVDTLPPQSGVVSIVRSFNEATAEKAKRQKLSSDNTSFTKKKFKSTRRKK